MISFTFPSTISPSQEISLLRSLFLNTAKYGNVEGLEHTRFRLRDLGSPLTQDDEEQALNLAVAYKRNVYVQKLLDDPTNTIRDIVIGRNLLIATQNCFQTIVRTLVQHHPDAMHRNKAIVEASKGKDG
jgi:hypothetical protein